MENLGKITLGQFIEEMEGEDMKQPLIIGDDKTEEQKHDAILVEKTAKGIVLYSGVVHFKD